MEAKSNPQTVKRMPQPSEGFFGRLADTAKGLWSLIVGLGVTGRVFTQKQDTVHYPRKTVGQEALTGYRGHIELVAKDDDPETARCIMCMKCVKVCPSGCISIKTKKIEHIEFKDEEQDPNTHHNNGLTVLPKQAVPRPGKGKRELSKFQLDYSLCSLCGLCVQNCPAKSLRHSLHVYWAESDRKNFTLDLLDRMRKQAGAKEEQ